MNKKVKSKKGVKESDKDSDKNSKLMTGTQRVLLGLYFVVLVPTILYFLIATWPVGGTDLDPGKVEYFGGRITVSIAMEARVIVLVILAGALGAFIHLGRSFTYFLGRQNLKKDFWWYYVQRPFHGAGLAFIFYLAFRGLFFTALPDDFNLYGVVAIAALAGWFSKQAIAKLKKVADELFTKVENIEKEREAGPEKLGQIFQKLLEILGVHKDDTVEIAKLQRGYEVLASMLSEIEKDGGPSTERWRGVLKTLLDKFAESEEGGVVKIDELRGYVYGLIAYHIQGEEKLDEKKLHKMSMKHLEKPGGSDKEGKK